MVFLYQILLPTVAFSALALAVPQPMSMLRRDSDPLSSNFSSDFDRGECVVSPNYSSDESRKRAWEAARGSELIDAYLNQNSRDDWATTIFKKLFPQESSSFDCWTSESTCDTNGHQCSQFSELNASGFFQVYIALTNFHTFVAQYLEDLQDTCDSLDRNLASMSQQFKRKEEPEPLNTWAILSGALSMLGGAASANPAVAGGMGALSGFATIMGEIPEDEAEIPDLAATEAGLQAGISDVCESTKARIKNTLKAVMGVPGSSEADIPWEMKMKDGEDTGYVHAISYLFGNGQWLLDHPTDGLEEVFDDLELHMKQGLAWQLLRLQHHAVMVINDASSCEDVNEIKDDENGYCYGLMYLNDELDNLEGGLNEVAAPLWASESEEGYDLNKLEAYRNALDCWLSNDATIGPVEPILDPNSSDYPKCFFGIEVKKGSWRNLGDGAHGLDLDMDFPNTPDNDLHADSDYWPWKPSEE